MKLNDFVCKQCGECCRHIDQVPELKKYSINGVCKYLKGNLCSIYDHRPDVCDRWRAYKIYKNQFTEEQFAELIQHYCDIYFEMKEQQDGR